MVLACFGLWVGLTLVNKRAHILCLPAFPQKSAVFLLPYMQADGDLLQELGQSDLEE